MRRNASPLIQVERFEGEKQRKAKILEKKNELKEKENKNLLRPKDALKLAEQRKTKRVIE